MTELRATTTGWRVSLAALLLLFPIAAAAEDDVAQAITAKIQGFYASLTAGRMDEAFAEIAVGGTGYLGSGGLLGEIPTQSVHAAVVQQYTDFYDNGGRINLAPKHIQVQLHAGVAVATFYVEGSVMPPGGETENVMNRGTMVWSREGERWGIVHWHISKITL